MKEYLEVALIECLDALEQGETVDQVLARYPDLADQLLPMLETAVALPQINIQPSLAAQHRSRDAFLAQASAMKDEKVVRPSPWLNLRRILMPIASLALVIILFAAGLGPLSANALPGDTLYEVKILVENARSALTLNPAADAALTEQFNQRRIQEVKTLLAENRTEDVAFTGDIEAIQPDSWTISGMAMQVTAETQIFGGDPFVGQMAMVDGRTQDGSLTATTITLLPSNEPPPTATPTATDLPTATPEPTETATPSPTFTYTPAPTSTPTDVPTATATATESPEPSPTITALPTDTPQPTPTNTPVSNDDGGSNDNSDSGDNSNDSNSNDNTNDNSDDNSNDNGDDNSNDNNENENDNDSNVNVNDNDGGHDDHSNT
ncbi:MAG: DUF5667 domain-containing protein, partial [Anaerolineae bacterium]